MVSDQGAAVHAAVRRGFESQAAARRTSKSAPRGDRVRYKNREEPMTWTQLAPILSVIAATVALWALALIRRTD